MTRLTAILRCLLAVAAVAALPARANIYTYMTYGNATAGGQPVSAGVTFDISAGSMVVTLTNYEPSIVSVSQDISSLTFNLLNGEHSYQINLANSSTTISGTLVDIHSQTKTTTDGSLVNVAVGTSANSLTHWTANDGNQGSTILSDLSGGGQPEQTIIGPAGSDGNYSSVNNSIYGKYGNGPHNPFIQNTATFRIASAGLLSTTSVSNVNVGFGTSSCDTPLPTYRKIPEPGSIALLGIGAIALGRTLRRRRRS